MPPKRSLLVLVSIMADDRAEDVTTADALAAEDVTAVYDVSAEVISSRLSSPAASGLGILMATAKLVVVIVVVALAVIAGVGDIAGEVAMMEGESSVIDGLLGLTASRSAQGVHKVSAFRLAAHFL